MYNNQHFNKMKKIQYLLTSISIIMSFYSCVNGSGTSVLNSAPNCIWQESEIIFEDIELSENATCTCNFGGAIMLPYYDLYSVFYTIYDAQIQWTSIGIGCSESTLKGGNRIITDVNQYDFYGDGFIVDNSVFSYYNLDSYIEGTIEIQMFNVLNFATGEYGTLQWKKSYTSHSNFPSLSLSTNAVFMPNNSDGIRYVYVHNQFEYH